MGESSEVPLIERAGRERDASTSQPRRQFPRVEPPHGRAPKRKWPMEHSGRGRSPKRAHQPVYKDGALQCLKPVGLTEESSCERASHEIARCLHEVIQVDMYRPNISAALIHGFIERGAFDS